MERLLNKFQLSLTLYCNSYKQFFPYQPLFFLFFLSKIIRQKILNNAAYVTEKHPVKLEVEAMIITITYQNERINTNLWLELQPALLSTVTASTQIIENWDLKSVVV